MGMKRDEWGIVLIPLLICWYFDRISKIWALGLEDVLSFRYLHFAVHHNPGAMLGLFSELPPVLRVVSLSTAGAFLVCIYVLIQYLLPIKSLVLRSGLSILLGGITGNVTDRILFGHVIDFIILGKGSYLSPAFNIADAVQWLGYVMIITAIFKEGEKLWPEFNSRRKYWINPDFQLKYSYLLLGIGLGISFISLVFSYTYLRVTMIEFVGQNEILLGKFLKPFVTTFILLSIGVSIGLFTVGKIISHKIAGPIFAFEKYIDEILKLEKNQLLGFRDFKLRTKDEFKNLERLAQNIRKKYQDPHTDLQTSAQKGPRPNTLDDNQSDQHQQMNALPTGINSQITNASNSNKAS